MVPGVLDALTLRPAVAGQRATAIPAEVARWDADAKRLEIGAPGARTVWRLWGDGAPLLLLHGGSGSWRHWIRNLGALLPGRLILAPDIPGLGESDLPEPVSLDAVVARVVAGLEQILGNGEACQVMGFSFGALVSGGVASRLQERISTVVLVGASGLGLPRGDVTLHRVRDRVGPARIDAHRANLASLMLADPANIDALALAIQAWNSDHARLRSVGLSPSDVLLPSLRASTARLRAIWGARDAVALPTLPQRIALLRSLQPGADIRTIEGAGHWVAYEAAEAFNAMANEMLGAPITALG